MNDIMQTFKIWKEKVLEEELQKELLELESRKEDLTNSFYQDLEFGTAGLRGIIGVGTNKMNVYTIRKATKGLADYVLKNNGKRVAICYDSRIKSDLFSKETAGVLAKCGIEVIISEKLMPTPFLAFITQEYGCDFGIMITASHNPKEYNGYKVFGGNGCQINGEVAKDILTEINKIDCFNVEGLNFEEGIKTGIIKFADKSMVEKYLSVVIKNKVSEVQKIKICYSALNGTGYEIVPEILKRTGQDNLIFVQEQCVPSGEFLTCPYPNPEKKEALELSLKLAEKEECDMLFATDPDADRIGIAVKHEKEFKLISGNEVGVLLADYLLSQKKKMGTLPKDPIIISTVVSTSLTEKIAQKYGATFVKTYTGFKWMGEVIQKLYDKGEEERFILAFEESYGYLIGSHVKDKDAVVSSMLICEMVAFYLQSGKTLVDRLNEIYAEFGLYEHSMLTYRFAGMEGGLKMKEIFIKLRKSFPDEIADKKIIERIDYLTQTELSLPPDNILEFKLSNGGKFIIRPSGTEPIVKIYMTAVEDKAKNIKTFEEIKKYTDFIFAD